MVLETNVLLTEKETKLREEIKDFVRSIDPDYLRVMEAEKSTTQKKLREIVVSQCQNRSRGFTSFSEDIS